MPDLRSWTAMGGLLILAACTAVHEPPGGHFVKMSQVSQFPAFLPGLGTLYVQPSTVPIGPYYGYDRQGRLIDTVYMVPLRLLDAHTPLRMVDDPAVQNLLQGTLAPVDHVEFHYTNGHPGVSEPHYHIILWHISPAEAAKVE